MLENTGIKKNKIIFCIYILLGVLTFYFALIPVINIIVISIFSGNKIGITVEELNHGLFYLKHSLSISIPVTIIATTLGSIMAFTINRLDFKGRKFLRLLCLLPLINPPFTGGISFIMLFGKRGLITHKLLGLSISPFGWQGIMIMQVLGLSTFAYILISSSIKKIDTFLEEAARNLGTKEWKVFFTVTLPLMFPELSNTALLVFLTSMADFSTPVVIGGAFQTLASDLYIQIIGVFNMRMASISGLFLLIPCLGAFVVQKYFIKKRIYVTDKIGNSSIIYKNISPAVKYLLITITLIFAAFITLKYGFIIIGAFTKQWGRDYTFTLQYFREAASINLKSFINSIRLAVIVSLISSFLGVFIAYLIQRKRFAVSGLVDFITTLPAAVPGILFGIGYLNTFSRPPLILLGTSIIIYIITITRTLNVGLRSGYALLEHLDSNLEPASLNLGENEIKTFVKVTLPLLKPAFFTAFLKNLTSTMTTLGAIILLLLPKNKVAVQQIFETVASGNIGMASALSVMLSFTSLLLAGLFYILFHGRDMINKRGGKLPWK